MEGMRTGLEHRLRRVLRRITEQHQQIRAIDAELGRATQEARAAEAHTWLERLEEALLAHFELEETLLFPALQGLAQESGAALDALAREHGELLASLGRMRAGVGSRVDGLQKGLPLLRDRLGEHERREEALIRNALARRPGGVSRRTRR